MIRSSGASPRSSASRSRNDGRDYRRRRCRRPRPLRRDGQQCGRDLRGLCPRRDPGGARCRPQAGHGDRDHPQREHHRRTRQHRGDHASTPAAVPTRSAGGIGRSSNPTSLDLNTITINGIAGDDAVDISQLTSAHRIVFRSNGGNDTIVGTLREQDVIELEPGRTADEYEWEENEDGTTSVTCGGHRVTFRCEGGRRPNLCEVPVPTEPEVPSIRKPDEPETLTRSRDSGPACSSRRSGHAHDPGQRRAIRSRSLRASRGTRQPRPQGQLAQRDAPRR